MLGTSAIKNFLVKVTLGLDDKDFTSKMKTVGKSMTSFGTKMSMGLTLPILGAGAAMVKFSTDFESSMSKVVGLVGVAEEQVAAWSKEILELSAEVAKAPAELADAMFFITSAGLRGAEAMDVLKMSARAATAGLGETKVVADLVTSAMNAYGKEALSAEMATNIMVAGVREGKAEASEFAGSLGRLLPIASNMGVSFDQITAAVAAMTRTGSTAQEATVQLRQVLASLLSPTSIARKELEKFGFTTAGIRKVIQEDGLLVALKQLTDALGDDAEATALIFGNIRALIGIMDLFGKGAESNAKIFEALTDTVGDLDKAFDAAAETAGFTFKQAMAGLQSAAIQFGDILSPLVQDFTKRITALIQKISEMSEEDKIAALKMAGIAAAIPVVILVLGQLITAITTIITLLAAPAAGLIALITAFGGAAFYTYGKLKLISGAGSPTVTLVGNLEDVKRAAEEAGKAMRGMADDSEMGIRDLLTIIDAVISKLEAKGIDVPKGEGIFSAVMGTESKEEVIKALKAVKIKYEGLNYTLLDFVQMATEVDLSLDKTKDAAEDAEEGVKGLGGATKEVAKEFVSWHQTINKMFSDEVADKILRFFDSLSAGFKAVAKAAEDAKKLLEGPGYWEKIITTEQGKKGFAEQAAQMARDTADTIFEAYHGVTRERWIELLADMKQDFIDSFGDFGVDVIGMGVEVKPKGEGEEAKNVVDRLNDVFLESIQDLAQSIQSGNIAGAIQNTFNMLGNVLSQHISERIGAMTAQSGMSKGLSGLLGGLGGGLVGVGVSLLGGLFGGKSRGVEPQTPSYVHVVNWDDFYQLGFSLPQSFIYSGRAGRYDVDPHGRALAISYEGWQTGQHFSP